MNSLAPVFDWTVAATLRASVLVLVVLIAQRSLRSRLSAKWKYALWLPVLVAILIPAQPLLPHWVRATVEPTQEPFTVDSVARIAEGSPSEAPLVRPSRSPDAIPSSTSSTDSVVENKATESAAETPTEIEDSNNHEDAGASTARAATLPTASEPTASEPTESDPTAALMPWRSLNWRVIVTAAWMLGVGCLSVTVLISYGLTLRRIRGRAIPLDEAKLAHIAILSKEMGLHRAARVWLSPVVKTPAVCGFWRPSLLLNADFYESLTDEESDFVLRHELMHIRRKDVLLNNLLCILLALHWFNPLLWFAFFRVRADREAACDADVLRSEGSAQRVAYGKTLLKLETSWASPGLSLGLVGILQGYHRLRDRIDFITHPRHESLTLKSIMSMGIAVTAVLGIAKAMESPQRPATPPVDTANDGNREPWQTDLSDLSDYLQSVVSKGTIPNQQYFVDRILRGTDSRAIPTVQPYAEHGEEKYFSGYADLTPNNGTIQWTVNETLKGRAVEWEVEIDRSRVITVGNPGSDREVEKRFLEVVPRYDAGDQPPITRISTIRVEISPGEPTPAELIAGDRVFVEGTIGDYATNQGLDLADYTGPVVAYKRKKNDNALQTTISIGLLNAKITPEQALPSFRFRQVASLPVKDKDAFRDARLAVSFDQNAVISRNYLVSRGQDVRDRIGAYLWRLDPKDPKRTQLPDSTTFGFVPQSNLAYQVHWGPGVQFWDTRTHSRSGEYIPHALREDTTIGPAVSPSGEQMVTRSQLDHLQFWDIKTRKPISEEMKQPGPVHSLGFSADGKWFFSASYGLVNIWDPTTGKLVAERLRSSVSSDLFSPTTNRVSTVENYKEKEDVWHSELVIRSGREFSETNRIRLAGRASSKRWIDDNHLVVMTEGAPNGRIGRGTVYMISLAGDKPAVRTLIQREWTRGIGISPDREHFMVSTRDGTSCWKIGHDKPIWTKVGGRFVSFGDRDWVLFHDGAAIVYSLADGRRLWRRNHVGTCRAGGSSIWTCDQDQMEVWRVEPSTAPKKNPRPH